MGKSKTKRREKPAEGDMVAERSGVTLVCYAEPIPRGTLCHYCGAAEATTRDHIVPRRDSGSSRWWNLVPSCQPCNLAKGHAASACRCLFCIRAKLGGPHMVKRVRVVA